MHEIPHTIAAEKIVLATVHLPGIDPKLFEEDLQEMQMLCTTAGAEIMQIFRQNRVAPDATTYIGQGKLKEIAQAMEETHATTFIIDAELSPGQIRNIEKVISGKVIDRSQLILDIFAQHAKTNEARIQVELAQLKTLYPRLTHAWTHFSQQTGGIGTRGPGEKQLEVDRRLIQKKITDLKDRLDKIEKSRNTQRKSREECFKIAIVGYTNVGKSSLLNALTGADVLVENKLFATLDTATRRTFIPTVGNVTISDTVGFLRKLPHHLVASFRSTLEVIRTADLLCIVLDASSPFTRAQLDTIQEVLTELKADTITQLLIFNKDDLLTNEDDRDKLEWAFPKALFASALSPSSMASLKEQLREYIVEFKKQKAMTDIIARQSAHAHDALERAASEETDPLS